MTTKVFRGPFIYGGMNFEFKAVLNNIKNTFMVWNRNSDEIYFIRIIKNKENIQKLNTEQTNKILPTFRNFEKNFML